MISSKKFNIVMLCNFIVYSDMGQSKVNIQSAQQLEAIDRLAPDRHSSPDKIYSPSKVRESS